MPRFDRPRLRGSAARRLDRRSGRAPRAFPDRHPGSTLPARLVHHRRRLVRRSPEFDQRSPAVAIALLIVLPILGDLVDQARKASRRAWRITRGWSAFYGRNLWRKGARDQIFFLASGITFNVLVTIVPLLLLTISILGTL